MQTPKAPDLSPKVLADLAALAKQLPAERIAARKVGFPLTGAELRARLKVPDRDNAAPFYRQLTKTKPGDAAAKTVTDALKELQSLHPTSAQLAAAKAALTASADRVRLFEQAAAKPGCDFARHWEDGANVLLPELARLREGARLLAIKAAVQSAEEKPLDALATLKIGAGLARHASADSILIGLLVGIAIDAILDRAFQTILARHGTRADVLKAADATAAALDWAPDLPRALGSEAVMAHETLRAMRQGKRFEDVPSLDMLPATMRASLFAANEVQILRTLRTMAVRPQRTDADLRALKVWSDDEDKRLMARAPKDPSLILVVVFRPSLSPMVDKLLGHRALRRLRTATLAVLWQRLRDGKLPARFDAVADPFDGAPLRYRTDGKGFQLWSIGRNRKDDGGVKQVGENRVADIVVAWP